MAVFEKEVNAPFTEVHMRLRKQLLETSHRFKLRNISTYKTENFQVAVMEVNQTSFSSRNKLPMTITIAGTKETTWISVIGKEATNQLQIRTGYDIEPNGMQLIKEALKCFS